MKIKFPTGSTAENNQLLLPEGFVTFDRERLALRLHDGVTQGGFEVTGEPAIVDLTAVTDLRFSNEYVRNLVVLQWRWVDMSNTFHFTNRNENKEDGIRVWRSDSPFDSTSLPPTPLLTLPAGSTQFTDEGVSRGEHYYYMLEVFKGANNRAFTDLADVIALPYTGPGPQLFVGGNEEAGFYGETPTLNLINGLALASLIGLTVGTAQFSEEPWLKFALDGKTLFVAKKPFRHSISWDAIQAVNAVDGSRIVQIQGNDYRVRLLKGANSDPYVGVNGYDPEGSWGSEWNRLMYHISGLPFGNANNTLASENIAEGDWAQYSEEDLLTHNTFGNGSYSWCQEVSASNPNNRAFRGNAGGVSLLNHMASTNENVVSGWRPCLELI